MGVKIVSGASLLPFNISLVQHGERHSYTYHIYKQIRWLLVREILTLEQEEGNNHDKLTTRMLLSLAMFLKFLRDFLALSQAWRDHHL